MLKKIAERVAVYADWSILALCAGFALERGMEISKKVTKLFTKKGEA